VNPENQNQAQQPTQPPVPPVSAELDGQPTAQIAPAPQAPAATPPEPKSLDIKFEDDLILTVAADTINDMRFLELYEEIMDNQLKLPKLFKFMFGPEEYARIFTYYESRGQKFTITKMGQVFGDLEKDLNARPDFLS
jgi:hypothetical protein